MPSNEISLYELDIVYHSEIEYDNFTLPIKIDIKDITDNDYAFAFSIMNNFKKNKLEPKEREHNQLDDMKHFEIINNTIHLKYEELKHQDVLDNIEFNKKMKYVCKFINTTDKLYSNNTKNLLEFVDHNDLISFFTLTSMSESFFNKIYTTISFWIDLAIYEFHLKVKSALLLNDEDGTVMNTSISKLKTCYDTLKIHYFPENEDVKCFVKLSYREQHLINSYNTKMHYIDRAINNKNKSEIDSYKNESANKPKNRRKSSMK